MKKDLIYNLKSLFVIKEKNIFSINFGFDSLNKIIKINNCKYIKEENDFKLVPYIRNERSLRTVNANIENRFNILIKHSIFNFYISKYKIQNKYLIKNIEEYYRVTKVLISMLNTKYGIQNQFEIETNHDVVFTILKYNESKLYDIEKYKSEKVENVFSEELYESIVRL